MATPQIEVSDLVIRYGTIAAVGPISFVAEAGKQLTLLGPSGCGKTTTLRAVAGLEQPASGRIRIGDKTMFDGAAGINLPAEQRGLSMVFQSYAIWPHMTVFDNVAYGLRVRGRSAAEIRERVGKVLDLVQMSAYGERSAAQLSGGQQQRVALARACAFSPSVLLFDEPLSNLDAKLRGDMRIELRELQHRLGVTSLYVTHDLEEALAMSDSIIVMRAGAIEQAGPPAEIYNFPRTEFVADFVGSANLIRGRVRGELAADSLIAVETAGGEVVHGTAHGRAPGAEACLSVRAVHFSLTAEPRPGGRNAWPVTIHRSVFLGDLTQVHVTWGGRELVVRQSGMQQWTEGQPAHLSVDPRHCVLLEA
ncbi:MAG TPA: ABC transporter ATP-binding protein [Pseudolabrys sp.]|nr:ABC transporter ATP-binding protein [Pseudolabrys sp.]